MAGRLAGKVALVTGAGSGIGRACAVRFAAEGAQVIVNDVDPARAAAVAAEIGGAAHAHPADVADAAAVEAMLGDTIRREGRLDVLVNNAAHPLPGTVEATTADAWRRVFAVTLDGTFHGVRLAIPVMADRGGGAIVNVASGAGLGGEPGLAAYAAAKAAVINLTQTAAVENAARGVRVNCICPGPIETPPLLAFLGVWPGGRTAFERQVPAGRLGRPEEIASVALFLASDEASFVTGAILVADGGVAARTSSPRS